MNTLNSKLIIEHVSFTAIAAITASIAAGFSSQFGLPVWAMFIGWVSFFTKVGTIKDSVCNLVCVWAGILIGMLAYLVIQLIIPSLGALSLPVVVFFVGMIVISLRSFPVLNNLICYFLGLITFFAAHLPAELNSISLLAAATGIGTIAGIFSAKVQSSLAKKAQA